MRAIFSDTKKLRRRAKKNRDSGLARVRRWWSRKYGLPSNHELFQTRTVEDLMVEWFEDLWEEKTDLERLVEDAEMPGMAVLSRLEELNKILGDEKMTIAVGDPVFDAWEAAVARGEEPDYSLTMKDFPRHGR